MRITDVTGVPLYEVSDAVMGHLAAGGPYRIERSKVPEEVGRLKARRTVGAGAALVMGDAPAPLAAAAAEPVSEEDLFRFLRLQAPAYAGTIGQACLIEHMVACASQLSTADQRCREAVGEILAAVAVHMRYAAGGYRMVRGYEGQGHTGVDQLWTNGNMVLVVEAKGGTARGASQREVHHGAIAHEGLACQQLTQMTPAWVFVGCDSIVQHAFTRYMGGGVIDPIMAPMEPAWRTALGVCYSLWSPRGAPKGTREVPLTGEAPTLPFHGAMGWRGGSPITLPKVTGLVIVNGKLVAADDFGTQPRVIVAEKPRVPKRHGKGWEPDEGGAGAAEEPAPGASAAAPFDSSDESGEESGPGTSQAAKRPRI